MSQKSKHLIVSFNSDGEEALASKKTLHDVCDALISVYDIVLIDLNSKNWLDKTIKLISKDKSPWFIAHHGGFGENGELLNILESENIPHTHSCAHSCAVLVNKHKTKLIYRDLSINTWLVFLQQLL
jgi:D-alanine-D-alanine ligase-like ATP-grasp enzyme